MLKCRDFEFVARGYIVLGVVEYQELKDKDGNPKKGVWYESRVMEYADLKRITNKAGKTIHVGIIFDICVEKGYELPNGAPRPKVEGARGIRR